MRPLVVVLEPVLLDHDRRFTQRVEDLPAEQLIIELAVKALHVRVFPWAPWLNVQRLYSGGSQPLLHGCGDELWPVVAANELRLSVHLEQVAQRGDHILGREALSLIHISEPT